jgi:hypothetical protein
MKLGMMPEARADLLGARLEQQRAVAGLERVRNRRSPPRRRPARSRCAALDRHAERGHLGEQRVEVVARMSRAQQRVAEHARRDRLGAHALLLGPALRRLGEVEELELERAHRLEAELRGAREHALQHLAAVERVGNLLPVLDAHEVAEEEVDAAVPRDVAMGREVDAGERVRVTLVPAGRRRVVVALVVHVPAVHDVAEAEAALDGGDELVLVQDLAAQDAVDVRDRDLDAGVRRLQHVGDDRLVGAGGRHSGLQGGKGARPAVAGPQAARV